MAKYGSKADIRDKALRAIRRHESFVEVCRGETNPQILEMVYQSQGQILGIQAMLDALNGNMVSLNVESNGTT